MIHSKFAPSSAHRDVHCHGARVFTEGIIEDESEEKKEGVAAHAVGQHLLSTRVVDPNLYIGKIASNGVIITDEMFDAALTYYNAVMVVAKHFPPEYLHIEKLVIIATLHPECFGTPDSWLYDPANRTVYIFDFKYGHLAVNVYDNYQLISYAIGVLDLVTGGQALSEHTQATIVNTIVSPRVYDGNGAVRQMKFSSSLLRNHANIIKHAYAKSEEPNAPLTAGAHCIGCLGRGTCPSLLKSVAGIIDNSKSPIPVNPSNQGLAYELQLIETSEKLLKYRKEALTQEALKRIQQHGTPIPGYTMDQGWSNRKWKPDTNPAALSKVLGVDFMKEPEPRTPAQSCLLMKAKGYDDEVIEGLFYRVPTSLRLKADDGTKAKLIFSGGKI